MNCLMQKKELYVQDKFVKNRVVCTIGASDCACTVGFIQSSKQKMARAFPKTLLKGNELKDTHKVELLLRRKKGNKKFDEILIGNREIIRGNFEELKEIVAVDLYIKKEENRMSKFYKHKMVYFKIKVPICFNPNAYVKRVIKCKLAYRSKRTYYE